MITVPTSATDNAKDANNRLNEKSGDDFDKTYADIKNWATLPLPDLRKHLDDSIECQKKCDNNYSK